MPHVLEKVVDVCAPSDDRACFSSSGYSPAALASRLRPRWWPGAGSNWPLPTQPGSTLPQTFSTKELGANPRSRSCCSRLFRSHRRSVGLAVLNPMVPSGFRHQAMAMNPATWLGGPTIPLRPWPGPSLELSLAPLGWPPCSGWRWCRLWGQSHCGIPERGARERTRRPRLGGGLWGGNGCAGEPSSCCCGCTPLGLGGIPLCRSACPCACALAGLRSWRRPILWRSGRCWCVGWRQGGGCTARADGNSDLGGPPPGRVWLFAPAPFLDRPGITSPLREIGLGRPGGPRGARLGGWRPSSLIAWAALAGGP